jgi:hypothetical protein
VTGLPASHINRLEFLALKEIHHSLYIPHISWVSHLNEAQIELGSRAGDDCWLSDMAHSAIITMARDAQTLSDKLTPRRVSYVVCTAADQAIIKDWGYFAGSYVQVNPSPGNRDSWPGDAHDNDVDDPLDMELEMEAARNVRALVDEDENVFEEDDDMFSDYDGAPKWMPPASGLQRITAPDLSQGLPDVRAIDQWRSTTQLDAVSEPIRTHLDQPISLAPDPLLCSDEGLNDDEIVARLLYGNDSPASVHPTVDLAPLGQSSSCTGIDQSIESSAAIVSGVHHHYANPRTRIELVEIEPGITMERVREASTGSTSWLREVHRPYTPPSIEVHRPYTPPSMDWLYGPNHRTARWARSRRR